MDVFVVIDGDAALVQQLNRLSHVGIKRAVRLGVNVALRRMAAAIRARVPPATTRRINRKTGMPHSTEKFKKIINGRFAYSPITSLLMGKVGVNVGTRSQGAINRAVQRGEKVGKRVRIQQPHAHLYFAGTVNRWTGEKRVGRKQRVVVDTSGTKMIVKDKGRLEKTGKARRFRGRVLPKDTVRDGAIAAWPGAQMEMKMTIYKAITRYLQQGKYAV